MRGVMRKVLSDVAESGYLPGDHHFTISFRTDAPGVTISRRLAEQWPQELTIILQHQYSNLEVDEDGFGVTLSFRSIPEHLYIPFAAVTGFFDPSVEFGLRFEGAEEEDEEEEEAPPPARPSLVAVQPDSGAEQRPAAGKSEAARAEQAKTEPAKATPAKADSEKARKPAPEAAEAAEGGEDAANKVVSIDAFRKKT